MNFIHLFIFVLSGAFGLFSVCQAAPVTLDQGFEAAVKRSETLATQIELITQAEERIRQSWGAILPTVIGTASYLVQAPPRDAQAGSFSPPNQRLVRLGVAQPLFRGLRDLALLKQQNLLKESAEWMHQQAMIQLYQDYAQNHYQVLSSEKDLENFAHELEVNHKRLSELENFRKIGRSRPSEVLLLQSNIAALEAQVESARGQLNIYRTVFEFLTGLDKNSILVDTEPPPPPTVTLEKYLENIEKRPDIQAGIKSAEASEKAVTIAQGGHLPSLDFLGNYYFVRPGLVSNVNWDFQLALSVPIFQGGVIQSQVRQAASVQRQSDLALSLARRQAKGQIEEFWSSYQRDVSQYEKQQRAVTLAQKTYEAQLHDYKLGLVTNLDVLSGLTTSEGLQRSLDQIKFQMKSDFIKLQSASAMRPQLDPLINRN